MCRAAASEPHLREGMTTPAVRTTKKYSGPVLLGFHANGMAGSGGTYLQQQQRITPADRRAHTRRPCSDASALPAIWLALVLSM
jgi:hypothetical protein